MLIPWDVFVHQPHLDGEEMALRTPGDARLANGGVNALGSVLPHALR